MRFDWDPDKNEWLKSERNISFERIIFHLLQGDIWKIAPHPNQKRYPEQKIYFVVIEEYVYLVPHVAQKENIFLKTVIPSRKATRLYRQEQEETDENR